MKSKLYSRKCYFLPLLFLLFFCCNIVAAEDSPKKFLLDLQVKHLADSHTVTAVPLALMRTYPMPRRFLYIDKSGTKLNEDQTKRLRSFITEVDRFDVNERLDDCTFQPGVSFNIYKKLKEKEIKFDQYLKGPKDYELFFKVLLCFNCDVWAIYGGGQEIIYADIRDNRDQLREFVKGIFGDDFFKRAEESAPDYDLFRLHDGKNSP